jgi:hypothetical protein
MKRQIVILFSLILLNGIFYAQPSEESTGKTLNSDAVVFNAPPHFRVTSKDSVKGKPLYDYFLLVKAKLNGAYDINGGMYEETFNAGKIPVWGDDDQKRFWMDMHQTQIRFRGQSETEHGTYTAYLEGDFWGGSKHFRLRHAWFEYKFADLGNDWSFVGHIGQDWSFFGDKEVWPNVMEWDGPSSGVWRREPELRFWFERNSGLRLEFGVANPGAEIYFDPAIDSSLTEAQQPLPDFIGAINQKFSFGHLRVTGIYRALTYQDNNDTRSVPGYGATFSGYIKTNDKTQNPVQFQFVGGQGIATYLVSFSGMNYDALPNAVGDMKAVEAFGGWASYEHWLSEKWHANIVLGYTKFESNEINQFTINTPGYLALNSTAGTEVQYLLLNIMWDPIPSIVLGIEWNYGKRTDIYDGRIVTPGGVETHVEQSRSANRISFGAFFNF